MSIMSKVSLLMGGNSKKNSVGSNRRTVSSSLFDEGGLSDEGGGIVGSSFSLDGSGDLCVEGNNSSSNVGIVQVTTRSGRKVIAKRKGLDEKPTPPKSLNSCATKGKGVPTLTLTPNNKVPKVPTTSIADIVQTSKEEDADPSAVSVTAITFAMKSKPSSQNNNSITFSPTVSLCTNGGDSPSEIQEAVTSGGPRTPGTPSDHGGSTPNPPTPGNTNSSGGMVNSPRQYVTITVDGEGGVVTEGGVGGTPSYVTYLEDSADHSSIYAAAAVAAAAANGHSMAYPLYNVGEGGTIYTSSGGTQYYSTANASSNSYSQDGGVYMVPATTPSGNNSTSGNSGGGDTSGSDIPQNLSHATRVSPTTKRKRKSIDKVTMEPVERTRRITQQHVLYLETTLNETQDEEEEVGDGEILGNLFSEAEMKSLSKLYPSEKSNTLISSSPAAVQWLLDNYETAEGVSLRRSTLYSHYLHHCSLNKLDPINAASFGKLIRSVFLGLRTRRLGTRGNSKYHYYGIRVKPSSPLSQLPEDFHYPSSGSLHPQAERRPSTGVGAGSGGNKRAKMDRSDSTYGNSHPNGVSAGDSSLIQQYLGDGTGALDDFPELDIDALVPPGLDDNDLNTFSILYKEHCELLLESLSKFQLGQLEGHWKGFWKTDGEPSSETEKLLYLPREKLVLICQVKAVQDFVKEVDYLLYQKMVGILLPDVLRPIPSTMTQAIRNFSKGLENCLSSAMLGYPKEMVVLKASIVSNLAQTLRRYTSLNHLAQAARAVLQNQSQITQMLSDLNRVDFHSVEEQASWVCGCKGDIVPSLEQDFKSTLAQQQTLEQWAKWLESVADKVLQPFINTPGYAEAARHFLLKWSFYSSLIIRDLTLRSAASFGSFHLLRLLYDEYMFFLVENRVADVLGVVPIAVIGKKPDEEATPPLSRQPCIERPSLHNGHSNGISSSSIMEVRHVNLHANSNSTFVTGTTSSLKPTEECRKTARHFLTS